jgi:cation diffusion facilitator CzcD-associated flavoprotein CzcO
VAAAAPASVTADPGRQLVEDVDVVIVGGGINGVGTARRLSDEGLRVVVLERQEELGGIWNEFANETSRSQNHEPAYRLGPSASRSQDYTVKGNLIAELWKGAAEAGVADKIRCGAEVLRVVDAPGEPRCRVQYRRGGRRQELAAAHVIFCTGSLQRPRNPALPGEAAFGGPVVLGLGSAVNSLAFAGKVVVIVGMGAFAIENARLAMLGGAAHVHMVARTRVRVTSRFTRVLNILSSGAFYHPRGEGAGAGMPPLDREELMRRQYALSDAQAAW